jgi:hypothetical protein
MPEIIFAPVSEIFKKMTEKHEAALSTTSPTLNAPSAPVSSTTSAATQRIEEPTRTLGPSIIVAPPLAGPESAPPDNAAAQSVVNDQNPYPAPIHKLVLIGSVMGGIIAFTLLLFLFFNRRAFILCRRATKTVPVDTKIAPFYEARKDDELGFSTDSLDISAWPKFPPPSATYQQSDKQAALQSPPSRRVRSKVIDITPNFPRSKFSITSSDYGLSPRCSINSIDAPMPPMPIIGEETPFAPPALLPPSEFFSLPSSPDLRRSLSSRHSRNHTTPIFGHDISHAFLTNVPSRMRAGDHRKSKSISGLVYAVRRPGSVFVSSHRRSTSSKFSQHKGTPPMNGLLSAHDS